MLECISNTNLLCMEHGGNQVGGGGGRSFVHVHVPLHCAALNRINYPVVVYLFG